MKRKALRRLNQHGFSMIELTIVLMIFGVLVAGVMMMVAASVRDNNINRLNQEVIALLSNTRSYARRLDGYHVNLTKLQDFDDVGLLPKDLTPGNSTNLWLNALGLPMDACAAGAGNTFGCSNTSGVDASLHGIMVDLQNLPSDVCVNLVGHLTAERDDLGLLQVLFDNTAYNAQTTDWSVAKLSSYCLTNNRTVEVRLIFSM